MKNNYNLTILVLIRMNLRLLIYWLTFSRCFAAIGVTGFRTGGVGRGAWEVCLCDRAFICAKTRSALTSAARSVRARAKSQAWASSAWVRGWVRGWTWARTWARAWAKACSQACCRLTASNWHRRLALTRASISLRILACSWACAACCCGSGVTSFDEGIELNCATGGGGKVTVCWVACCGGGETSFGTYCCSW